MSETYTVKQVAEILGFSTNSIYTFLKQGRIKGVRVGKGRFRITEDELGRILHLSKKQTPGFQKSETKELELSVNKIPLPHIDIASLFDWFVGATSIVVSLTLLLFNQYLSRSAAIELLDWTLPIQVSLIAAGMGLIITDIFSNKFSKFWHKLFHLILIITYLAFAITRYKIGEFGTSFIFGLMGMSLIVNFIFQIRGIEMLLLLIGLFTIGSSIILLYKPSAPWIIEVALENYNLAGIIFVGLSLVFAALAWWSYKRIKRLFWLLCLIYGGIFILLSFWFASNLSWTKGFFVLSLGLTTLLVPIWDAISVQKRLERKFASPVFLVMMMVMTMMVGVIWLMERNMREFASRELKNKNEYGQILVESTLESTENSVIGATKSKVLLDAVENGDGDTIKEALRLLIEGNPYIKTSWVLNSGGDLLNVYPHVIVTEQNFYNRDYFRQAMNGKVFISNLFQAKTKDQRNTVVVSAPIFGRENDEIVGIIAASVNLDYLSTRLQKVANPENGEYFILIDKKDRVLASPDRRQIGKLLDIYEDVEKTSINEYEDSEIVEKTGWRLKIRTPIKEILRPTRTVSILLFGGISFTVLLISAYIFLVKKIHLISP